MSCFDNLIAIKSTCNGTTGTSGFFIEDIGITAEETNNYINQGYVSGAELITDKMRFATDIVRKTIANNFAAHINTKSLIDAHSLGVYQDNVQTRPTIAASLGGISLMLNNGGLTGSGFGYANQNSYLNVFVNSISLQLDADTTVDVLVYDLVQNKLLDTITIDCIANEITTKYINKVYSSPKRKLDLIFVYDISTVQSNYTVLSDTGCGICNGYAYSNYYVSAQAIYMGSGDPAIRSSLTSTDHTFGMSVNYSVQCSIENWLCEIANLMALPILYKTGEEIMNYACMYSNRQNSNINVDAERNEKRRIAYQSAYNEALEATIKKINLPKGDVCFKCNVPAQTMIILP